MTIHLSEAGLIFMAVFAVVGIFSICFVAVTVFYYFMENRR